MAKIRTKFEYTTIEVEDLFGESSKLRTVYVTITGKTVEEVDEAFDKFYELCEAEGYYFDRCPETTLGNGTVATCDGIGVNAPWEKDELKDIYKQFQMGYK